MTKLEPMINLPDANLIIDLDKAFALQRIGVYSSKLKENIVHSFMFIDNLCSVAKNRCLHLYFSFNVHQHFKNRNDVIIS